MAEAEQQPVAREQQPKSAPQQQQQQAPVKQKEVLATKVTGVVKWFNVKCGYGFINRNDTKEDVFVHQSAIVKNNPRKFVRSVGDGEMVEFSVVIGDKGNEAANVTGPNGDAVRGSPYAADRKHGYRPWFRDNRGGRGRGGPRRPRHPRDSQSEGEAKDGAVSGGEEGGNQGGGPPRRYRSRRGGYGGGGGGYYNRGPYRGGPQGGGEQQDQNGEAAPRGRGPPRRYFRRNFRGARGGGRRPQSEDSQGQAGDQVGQEGPRLPQRPHYRRRGGMRPRRGNSQSESTNNTKTPETAAPAKTEETQPVQNTTTESTA